MSECASEALVFPVVRDHLDFFKVGVMDFTQKRYVHVAFSLGQQAFVECESDFLNLIELSEVLLELSKVRILAPILKVDGNVLEPLRHLNR